MRLADIIADGGAWFETYGGYNPIPDDHPPSLRNPIRTRKPSAQDGWKTGDSKRARAQAMLDLVEIHKRLRRQFGKPEVSQGANYPLYPSIANTW